ncbi:hypothetical protein PCASD_16032 [Puccinia coronata f. sp. avenae]|uniref:Secreted protein n=1 Tax=Puccinia coronata f. sp. avenae TaxID=200324 RepID=A0A2N5TZT0_9BASI|nr:hypothetical protein PCASD_16032 [Puccinia coronata f. sp. avenae]
MAFILWGGLFASLASAHDICEFRGCQKRLDVVIRLGERTCMTPLTCDKKQDHGWCEGKAIKYKQQCPDWTLNHGHRMQEFVVCNESHGVIKNCQMHSPPESRSSSPDTRGYIATASICR